MNILDKRWKRLLIAFALAAMLASAIRQLTHEKVKIAAILLWVILYFMLTNFYTRRSRE